ncbi:Transcription factor-like protein DPA [Hibiscus syriacus]|uniref:Transcription factor-like protein DPA n=1 Tax=Hibiscus syriacus TaxID=106335 RepID=A0A6A2X9A1_HIBSY|nr:Transcription factor-like protein DPA [Hibiscus syriacus]
MMDDPHLEDRPYGEQSPVATPTNDSTSHRMTQSAVEQNSASAGLVEGAPRKKVSSSRMLGGGLRQFSVMKLESKGSTTYAEVADEITEEFATAQTHAAGSLDEFHEKNVRRRVYDALNVLMATDIITREKKEIRWKGISPTQTKDLEEFKAMHVQLMTNVSRKAAYSKDLEEQCSSRRAWLSCKGIPPFVWSHPTLKNITDKWGELISIEEGTLNLGSFDRALIQFFTNCQARVEETVDLKVGDRIFTVRVSEFEPCFSPESVWVDSSLMDKATASPLTLVGESVGVSPVKSHVMEVCAEEARRRTRGNNLSGEDEEERNIGEEIIMGLRNLVAGKGKVQTKIEEVVEHEIILDHAEREAEDDNRIWSVEVLEGDSLMIIDFEVGGSDGLRRQDEQ